MTLAHLQRCLRARDRHLSAFLVLGDPDFDRSLALARAAVDAGATMLELGIAYDDPCADGPAIQAATRRARRAGVSTDRALELLTALSRALPEVPKNLLVYGNLVHARGYAAFCRDSAHAGASSLLVPDVPLEEAGPLRDACRAADLGHVALVTPTTPPARAALLADHSADAFVYLAALQGVTGSAQQAAAERDALVQRVVAATGSVPVCVGFGLADRSDVDGVLAAGARIAVVGSHLARVIARHADRDDLVPSFAAACAALTPTPGDRIDPQTQPQTTLRGEP